MVRLSLLGSTGSIGIQTLHVVRGLCRCGDFPVVVDVLAARSNIELLEEQIREFKPKVAVVFEKDAAKRLRDNIRDIDIEILEGIDGLCAAASLEGVDIVLNSVVGMIGLRPTLAAIEAKKTIALANKETLVAGGSLVMKRAAENGVKIIPVDSEHSAIFQCLQGCNSEKEIKRLIITASGGPFFGKKAEELKAVRVKDALSHPNWNMGAKITIDSATMMNKGLEVIEATWLFDMPVEKIDVLVHRESIVHSLVEYNDNSVIAQMGVPDMQIPIQYAITYPRRFVSPAEQLNLAKAGNLSFYEPDYKNFKAIKLCIDAIKTGGTAPAIVNGANEEAVSLFLQEKISFLDISDMVEKAVNKIEIKKVNDLQDVLEADRKAREYINM